MSKKQKKLDANLQEKQSLKEDEISQGVVASENDNTNVKQNTKLKDAKADKTADKKGKKKEKKEKKGGVVKKTKETLSELKKVTWPTFPEVVKKTGIVIAFVVIFGLFLFGVNTLLGYLVGLLF